MQVRLAIAVALLILTAYSQTTEVGQPLPPRSAGTLDIHQISTGRGNSALLVFPDGTSLLVDAGDTSGRTPSGSSFINPPKPDGSRGPGEWIARYARHMLSQDPNPAIDYAYVTHFHVDHMGVPTPQTKRGRGGYQLTGIAEVAEHIPIRTILDRGWPDYNYPAPLTDAATQNYRAFLTWQRQNAGLTVERFQPGRNNQIAMRRDANRYPTFEVRNIAANGQVWTGVGTNTREHFPPIRDLKPDDYPPENICSVAIRLRYGQFDYFTGGDISGVWSADEPAWWDVETPIAKAVGPVDASVANHHGMYDAMNATFLRSLQPRVIVIPVWGTPHPGLDTMIRMRSTRTYPGERDLFSTDLVDADRIMLATQLNGLTSTQGHVLIRVDPGGATFRVIVLDDSDEVFRVKSVHGPYHSR